MNDKSLNFDVKFPKAKLEYAFKGSDKILLIVGKVILKSVFTCKSSSNLFLINVIISFKRPRTNKRKIKENKSLVFKLLTMKERTYEYDTFNIERNIINKVIIPINFLSLSMFLSAYLFSLKPIITPVKTLLKSSFDNFKLPFAGSKT